MVAEKMKLQILKTISTDLYNHVDSVFNTLMEKRNVELILSDIIEDYLNAQNKSHDLLGLKSPTRAAIEVKRDISFIYYCISCPFYYNLGVDERLSSEQIASLYEALNIPKLKLPTYIASAKHYYKFYSDYRDMIDSFVKNYIKK